MTVEFYMKANVHNIMLPLMFAVFTLLLRSTAAFLLNKLHPRLYMYVWQSMESEIRPDAIEVLQNCSLITVNLDPF
jgi:hypothetical protein